MKEELEKIINKYLVHEIYTDDVNTKLLLTDIINLFNKRIEDSKSKIDNYLLPLIEYKAQDIINIIKKEVNK